jgi:organic hydroperoxide reductase OsmC/OhrA
MNFDFEITNGCMTNYPMNFSARSQTSAGIQTVWTTTTADDRTLNCSIPKEFGGPNTGYSPEDLYLLALLNCYIATFKVIAANSKMSFESLEGSATLTLDRDGEPPTPWMKSASLKFTARGVENAERFQRLMERVSKQCMIINSVKTNVSFEFEILA